MAGTNLYSQVSSTLWIGEVEPVPTGTNGKALALSAACNGAPPTTADTFAHGCQIIRMDSGNGNPALYENTGTAALPTWNLVGSVTPGEITLANTQILVGNASNVAAAVALSGDATIANTGALTIANSAVTDAKVSASAAIAYSKLAALPDSQILVGSALNVPTATAVTGDVTISNAGVTAIASDVIVNADVKTDAAIAWSKMATLGNGGILVGNAGGVPTATSMGGDANISNVGTVTITSNAVTGSKVADSAGVNGVFVKKHALVVYDFAVDGGAQGPIAITGSPTIPDNSVVWVESYDVLTTATSATDAATIKLGLDTDGDLTTAVAISDGSNPWDQGVFSRIAGGLATPLTLKTTGARTFVLTVAGGENVTAGKVVFEVSYWVSQ